MSSAHESDRLASEALGARRLGILGGSFDPPHRGHLHAARTARRAFDLDHVLFVPARRPPHKLTRRLAGSEERVELLRRLLTHEAGTSTWGGELLREGPSYSVDTAHELTRRLPSAELFWILGSDNLAGLAEWHRVERLLELCHPIVVLRRGEALDPAVVERLGVPLAARIAAGFVEEEPVDASSTALRSAFAEGRATGDALPPTLREYVLERGIYSSG